MRRKQRIAVTKGGEDRRNDFSSEAGDCVGLPIWDCLELRYLGSLTRAFGSKYRNPDETAGETPHGGTNLKRC